MLDDVKELYTGNEPDFELAAQYAVTAVGYKNGLEVNVGGEKVDAYPEEICETEIVRDSVKENHYEQALKEEIDVEKPMKKSKPVERD